MTGIDKITALAKESSSAQEFIWKIQDAALHKNDRSLLDGVYEYEKTNPEKFKNLGWFRIAAEFYNSQNKKS